MHDGFQLLVTLYIPKKLENYWIGKLLNWIKIELKKLLKKYWNWKIIEKLLKKYWKNIEIVHLKIQGKMKIGFQL